MYVLNTDPPTHIDAEQRETLRRLVIEAIGAGSIPSGAEVTLLGLMGPNAPERVRAIIQATLEEAADRSSASLHSDELREAAAEEILRTVVVDDEDVDVYRS